MKFEIPAIKWQKDGLKKISTNAFITYTIFENGLCNYGEGKFKQCQSVEDAMDWVENTHYPAQVKKYFRVVP